MKPLTYHIKRSLRIKKLSLTISNHYGIMVKAPEHLSEKVIERFIHKHQHWIHQHQHLIDIAEQPFLPPDTLFFLAIQRQWSIVYGSFSDHQPAVQIFPEKILMHNVQHSKQSFKHLMHPVLKNIAISYLTPHLHTLSDQHQLPFKKLSFRLQKTRWGSCSYQHHISLNAALLFMPLPCVHYVMLHELCHTLYFNHSPDFWNKLGLLMPDYSIYEKKLRQPEKYLPRWLPY
jgi:predicted metal-dependent hydrolase